MSIKLADGTEVDILVNEKPLPLNAFSSPMLQIDGSDEFGIPILTGALIDATGGGLIKLYSPIPDGALISVVIGTGAGQTTREFRASGCSVEGATIALRGYLNHPNYVVESTDSTYHETSYDALKRIADRCGFAFECPVTSDRTRWACVNQRLINAARYILGGSFVSASSMMAGAIRLDGLMKIVDLSNKQQSKGLFGFAPGALPVYGLKPTQASTSNLHGGYKQVVVYPDLVGGNQTISDMDLTVQEVSLNRNPKLANLSGSGAVKFLPPAHPRNIHQNFARAQYNNKRLETLYSINTVMLLQGITTTLDALDCLTLSNASTADGTGEGNLATVFDGDWIVGSKSIYIDNGQYFEAFRLKRMGLNVDMHSNTV